MRLRASQINGCGFCVDMHTKEAAHAGETATRLNLVAAWREATVFTEAERAALELAEQGTRLADAAYGVPDEVWANAAKHYDDEQLAALVAVIAIINAFNRGNVITQQPAATTSPACSADPAGDAEVRGTRGSPHFGRSDSRPSGLFVRAGPPSGTDGRGATSSPCRTVPSPPGRGSSGRWWRR